jgi:hypothetical protein
MKIILFSVLITVTMLQAQNPNGLFDQGHLSKTSFHNKYLNIELPVAIGTWLRIKEDITVMTDTGFINAEGINAHLNYGEDPKTIDNAYLLMLQKYDPRLRIKRFNPTIYLSVEGISHLDPPLIDEGQYLYQARERMKSESDITYDFKDGFKPLEIASTKCFYMDVKGTKGTDIVNQRFISFFRRGFAVSFILVYQDQAQLKALMAIVEQAKL